MRFPCGPFDALFAEMAGLGCFMAERIVRLANLVGRDNVIASTDCGFAQGPFARGVHPSIQWAKLRALAEGARLATRQLWRRGRKNSVAGKVNKHA